MLSTILGSKGKMSQTFVEGYRVPVTKILAGPCVVTQIKKEDKDGYWAVQLGFGTKRIKNVTKPLQGHLKKSQISNLKTQNFLPRYLREIRLEKEPEVNVGDTINASDIFNVGDIISVTGISKGKGFQGVVKRWHFAGGPATHGQSDRPRSPGSIGQTTTPGRVYKGKKMAGRMGGERVTVKNLHIVSVNPEKNELSVSGPVPGTPGGLLTINKIKSGSLKELERETVTEKVVEGEAPAPEGGEQPTANVQQPTAATEEKPKEEVANAQG